MSSRRTDDADRDSIRMIEETAADWIARREFGLAPTEEAALREWLNRDPRHRQVFGELAGMAALLAPYDAQVQAEFSKTVGISTVDMPLVVGGKQVCRLGECLLGDLVTDAMLWRANSTQPGRAPGGPAVNYQIAIQNGGGLRAPLVSGTLSVGSVEEVLEVDREVRRRIEEH